MPEESGCDLCGRRTPRTTVHHLTPRQKGGQEGATADLCPACHRQIHALFTNQELAEDLNTLEHLRSHPQISRFLRWIRKQDPGKRIRVDRRRSR
ncbi:MAG: HNH endonuclease [Thermoanaerobaculia bacterium]|nr:HNH endonuclease [Thermoanaerobaculia bacterium]